MYIYMHVPSSPDLRLQYTYTGNIVGEGYIKIYILEVRGAQVGLNVIMGN